MCTKRRSNKTRKEIKESATRKEELDALYKEVVMDMFNKTVKDNGITEIHATGLDMTNPNDILKVAVYIGAHSKNGAFVKESIDE